MTRNDSSRTCLHHLVGTRAKYLSDRDRAEEESADQGEKKSSHVNMCVRIHWYIYGKFWNRPPGAQHAQERNAAGKSNGASAERNNQGFGEDSAQNALAAR